MLMIKMVKLVFSFLIVIMPLAVFAQDTDISGTWLTAEKNGKIKIYKAKNDKYYGKVEWLAEPNENGKPKVDKNNPDKTKRDQPIMGLTMLIGFEKTGNNKYEDGKIYDPKSGKTYSCVMTHKGQKLEVRGYVGVSWMGRTEVWTKVE